ncbi:MAG: hypothetical protein KDA60_20250, partial [Planctomycetales bacterium]|nr:hypothetical protein [Planctomycetales bacterium]
MSYRLMYVVIAFLLVVKSTVAAPFSRIVVFGDSLLDAGNVQAMSSGELPPWPAYYQGRWTNGPVFSDYLAERLGLPTPEASRRGGTNYAHSGAETGWDWTDESITFSVPGMGLQVDDFLANDSPTDSDLIIIYGG